MAHLEEDQINTRKLAAFVRQLEQLDLTQFKSTQLSRALAVTKAAAAELDLIHNEHSHDGRQIYCFCAPSSQGADSYHEARHLEVVNKSFDRLSFREFVFKYRGRTPLKYVREALGRVEEAIVLTPGGEDVQKIKPQAHLAERIDFLTRLVRRLYPESVDQGIILSPEEINLLIEKQRQWFEKTIPGCL